MRFVKTTTADHLVFQGIICEPTEPTQVAILHIHGMAGNFWEHGFIKTMSQSYPAKGITFLSVEHRGSELLRWFRHDDGTFLLGGNAYETFEDSVKDISAWVSFLEKNGYKDIYLQGHSLGCCKIAHYVTTQRHESIKGIILISPSDMHGIVLTPSYRPKHDQLLAQARQFIAEGKDTQMLSEVHLDFAFLSARTYVNLFGQESKTAIFNFYAPELGFETMARIDVPILSILGTKDDGIVIDADKATSIFKERAIKCPCFVGRVFKDAQHTFHAFEGDLAREAMDFVEINSNL